MPFQIKDSSASDIYYIFWYLDAEKAATPTCPYLSRGFVISRSSPLASVCFCFFCFFCVWNIQDGWNPENKIFYSKAFHNFSSNSLLGEFQTFSVNTEVMVKLWMKGEVFHMPSETQSSLEQCFIFSQGFLLGEV